MQTDKQLGIQLRLQSDEGRLVMRDSVLKLDHKDR